MRTVLLILVVLAAADLLLCGAVLAFAWAEYQRVRRAAVAAGRPEPPAATREFLLLAAFGLTGIAVLYGAVWLLLSW